MRVKTIVDEDFVNYKKPAMFIGAISCNWKCCLESGIPITVCQNNDWSTHPCINISDDDICLRYLKNPITQAVVLGGLEPFDQYEEVVHLTSILRRKYKCCDDIVIYTGYTSDELKCYIRALSKHENIIVKFGRYIPNRSSVYDDVLGITLASDNQYAMNISCY